jgi:hypothetical protein
MPILVVGTKADLAKTLREKVISRSSSIAEECGADENVSEIWPDNRDGLW